MHSPRWPRSGQPAAIAQKVEWSHAGREYHGQVAEIDHGYDRDGDPFSRAVVDGSDGNRWHFDLTTGAITGRFPIPLPPLPTV